MPDGDGSGPLLQEAEARLTGRKIVSFPDCPHGRGGSLHSAVAESLADPSVAVSGKLQCHVQNALLQLGGGLVGHPWLTARAWSQARRAVALKCPF
jgi:hypothetical protein